MWLEQLGHKFLCDRGRDSFRNLKLRLHFGRSALECGGDSLRTFPSKGAGKVGSFAALPFVGFFWGSQPSV
jgi:hypothetical protein